MPPTYEYSMPRQLRKDCMLELLRRKHNDNAGFKKNIAAFSRIADRLLEKPDTIVLPYVEVSITSRCSLTCRHCANLMQYYRPERHLSFSAEDVARSIDKLLECVDFYFQLRFMGGEPLLHKDLPSMVRHALTKQNIGSVQVISNGTIFPGEELLDVLAHPRASLCFSDYGTTSAQLQNIVPELRRRGIVHHCVTPGWRDNGPVRDRGYSRERLREVYSSCGDICKTLLGDELHVCPRSAHGVALEAVPRVAADYVSLHAQGVPETKAKIRALYDAQSIAACGYCTHPSERPPIPAAEQPRQGERLAIDGNIS